MIIRKPAIACAVCMRSSPVPTALAFTRSSLRRTFHYVEDPDRNSQITEPLFKLNGTADFMLFYYCGHGVRDSQDKLYFALTNTVKSNPAQVPATAFPVDSINAWLEQLTNIPQKLVIYDCCHGGAGPRASIRWGQRILSSAITISRKFAGRSIGPLARV